MFVNLEIYCGISESWSFHHVHQFWFNNSLQNFMLSFWHLGLSKHGTLFWMLRIVLCVRFSYSVQVQVSMLWEPWKNISYVEYDKLHCPYYAQLLSYDSTFQFIKKRLVSEITSFYGIQLSHGPIKAYLHFISLVLDLFVSFFVFFYPS